MVSREILRQSIRATKIYKTVSIDCHHDEVFSKRNPSRADLLDIIIRSRSVSDSCDL
jgi:hypothetical protein